MIVEEYAHPCFCVSYVRKLMNGTFADKAAFYDDLVKIPAFKKLEEELNDDYLNNNDISQSSCEKIPKEMTKIINEETNTSVLNTDNSELISKLIEMNEVGIFKKEETELLKQEKRNANKVSPYAIARQVNFADGRNKKPAIAEKVNERYNFKFEKSEVESYKKDYGDFSLKGMIELVDTVKKTALLTKRTSSLKEKKEDLLTAQFYMELTGYDKCIIAYSIKNDDLDYLIHIVKVDKDTLFAGILIKRLNEITRFIRSLTKEDFKRIYDNRQQRKIRYRQSIDD